MGGTNLTVSDSPKKKGVRREPGSIPALPLVQVFFINNMGVKMFTADSRTEKFLEGIGVQYNYTNEMSFSKLDPKWTMQNLGRSQVKIDGAIDTYGKLMNQGSAAPAPILWRNPETKNYEVLDGMQRLMAEELRNPVKFSCYLVETDSESMARKIRIFANYRLQGGYQESAEWTLERAIECLLNKSTMSVEEVAEMGGWSPSLVRDKRNIVEARMMVRSAGGPEKMTDSILRVICKNSNGRDFEAAPVPLAAFANDLQKMRLSAEEATPYIEKFFSVSRSRGKLFDQFSKRLDEFRKDDYVESRLADPGRKRYQKMTAEGKVLKSLKSTLTIVEDVLKNQEPIYHMAEYFQVNNKIKAALLKIERMSKRK
jgi:hypothetical protein